MELAVNDRTRTIERLTGRMEKELYLKNNKASVVEEPLNDDAFTGDAGRVGVVSDDEEEQPLGQEAFVQQVAKQEV